MLGGLAVLLAACGGSGKAADSTDAGAGAAADPSAITDAPADTTAGSADGSAAPGTGWTVLVYSIADTNLEPYLLTDLGEMAAVGTEGGLQLAALVDRSSDYSSDPLLNLPDWHGGKLIDIRQGSMVDEQDLGDVDTGDPELLSAFITRGIQEHPAAHYALIISDHGASWPGLGGDESSNSDSLSVAELKQGIGSGLAAAGVDKLDLLGFDACLMASYEVATEIAPLADRLVASQELEPGHGWDYTALKVLADNPDTTADEFGSALIRGFSDQADAEGTKPEITLAMIDLTKMGAVDDALSAFTGQLTESATQVAPVVGKTRADTLGFGKSPDPTEDTQMTDLGLLASHIGVDALYVSDAADTLVKAINDAVVDSVAGSGTQGATGLSIYFPPKAELLDAAYAGVTEHGGWSTFLASYYGAGDAITADAKPQFQSDGDLADTSFAADGLHISGTFDPADEANLSDATMSYGTIEADGSITFFGEEPGTISSDGSGVASGVFDLTTLTISDGTETAQAYLTLSVDDSAGTTSIDVPMAYYSPDDIGGETYQDVLLTLTLDTATGDIVNETYYSYDDKLGTYGELTADPKGIIVPEVLKVGADGSTEWVPTSDVGLYADLPSLQYDVTPLASGTPLYIDLTVTDFGGNSATVSANVTVP